MNNIFENKKNNISENKLNNFLTKEEKQHINKNWREKLPNIKFFDITKIFIEKDFDYILMLAKKPEYSNTCLILKNIEGLGFINLIFSPSRIKLIIFNKDNYLQIGNDIKNFSYRIIEKFQEESNSECPICCEEVVNGRRCYNCGEINCIKCIVKLFKNNLNNGDFLDRNVNYEKNIIYRECIYCKYQMEFINNN